MKFEVQTEVSIDVDDFVGKILCNFDDYVYDLMYENEYVMLSSEQKTKLKIAIFEKAIETLKEEEEED